MAQEITNFFAPRTNRGSITRSPVKPRTSSSTSSGPSSALKTISNNKSYPLARDIAVFRDPSPKPRKTSDTENSDCLTSSQDSNHSSDSLSGSRKSRSSKKPSQKKPPSPLPLPRLQVETRDEGVQTEDETQSRAGETEGEALPKDAFDLLSDEPSENYYKDLAEARREALAETLEENQNLHELNDQLQGERDRLSSDFLNLSSANENLLAEMAKYSRLNETLEEENRLLKEALGLDVEEDEDEDEDEDEQQQTAQDS